MKIERTTSAGSSPIKRSDRTQKSPLAKFAKEVARQDTSADPVSGAAPTHAVDALLAIQEVEDGTTGENNTRARQWGGDVLDRLDAIRLGLLAGGIDVNELRSITNLVTRQRQNVSDPALQEILDEIELRARVELAKHERDS
jgi:hypothetical protein